MHFRPLLGDGIFTQSALAWRHSRDAMRPFLTSSRAANFEKMRSSVEALCDKVPQGGLIDLQPLFFDFTLETAISFLFGGGPSSIGRMKSHVRKPVFADAFTSAQEYLSYRSRLGGLYWLVNTLGFRRACATTRMCMEDMVQKALDCAPAPDRERSGAAFIDNLQNHTKDKTVLRDQCINILLASRDTMACSLTWTM